MYYRSSIGPIEKRRRRLAVSPRINLALRVVVRAELLGVGWTNVTTDVIGPISAEYGISGGGPLDRVASIGTMGWRMRNSARATGGLGYYTPGHANARLGWDIGIAVSLEVSYNGTTYYKFRGTLISVEPDTGLYRRRSVTCLAQDWIADAANCLLRDMAVQNNKRSDQLVTTIVQTAHHRQPVATDFNVGQSTFAISLDNVRDESTTGLRALADVTMAEGGYLYVKGDTTQGGTLKFEDRHARPKAASVATFNNTMQDLEAIRSRDHIITRANVMVHPRKLDAVATTVLWELTPSETVPALVPGETVAFTGLYRADSGRFARVGGDQIVTPVATTDYLGNAASDGSGSDLTASLSLVFASSGNSATFAFTNNHASSTIYLTKVQVRGRGIEDRFTVTVFAKDDDASNKFGERDISYDMIFEDRLEIAKGFADWIIDLHGGVRTVVSLTMLVGPTTESATLTSVLAREPGDKITVTESMAGITSVPYFINGMRLEVRPGAGGPHILTSLVLAPASQQQFWILEDAVAGLLETSTVLGFV